MIITQNCGILSIDCEYAIILNTNIGHFYLIFAYYYAIFWIVFWSIIIKNPIGHCIHSSKIRWLHPISCYVVKVEIKCYQNMQESLILLMNLMIYDQIEMRSKFDHFQYWMHWKVMILDANIAWQNDNFYQIWC